MLKRLKIAGLCLVAVFAVSAVGAASAFASPEWLQNGSKLTSALSVTSKGKLKLTDTKGGLKKGSVTIECTGTDKGTVGPGAADELTEVKATECKHVAGEECPSPSAEAVHLPWKTELYEEGSAIRDKVANSGAGLPGWKVKCSILSDTCEAETSTAIKLVEVGIVDATFEEKSAKANCSRGGTGTGVVEGTDVLEAAGLEVS